MWAHPPLCSSQTSGKFVITSSQHKLLLLSNQKWRAEVTFTVASDVLLGRSAFLKENVIRLNNSAEKIIKVAYKTIFWINLRTILYTQIRNIYEISPYRLKARLWSIQRQAKRAGKFNNTEQIDIIDSTGNFQDMDLAEYWPAWTRRPQRFSIPLELILETSLFQPYSCFILINLLDLWLQWQHRQLLLVDLWLANLSQIQRRRLMGSALI